MLYNDNDNVYFNIASWGIIDYPFSWVMPMLIIAIVVFVVFTGIAIKRKQLSIKGILLGFLPATTSLISVIVFSIYGWQLSSYLFPYLTEMPHGFTYNGHWIIAFAIILSLLLTLATYKWFNTKYPNASALEQLIAPTIIWLLINALFAVYLVGAGFFIVTLIAPLMLMALFIWNRNHYTSMFWVVALPISISLLVITPQIPLFVIGLGLSNLVIATTLTSLLLLISLPLLMQLKGQSAVNRALGLALLACLVGIISKSGYDSDHKKPNNINYVYDTQTDQAYLFSYSRKLDGFTSQFFDEGDTANNELGSVYPTSRWNFPYFTKPISAFDIKPTGYSAVINQIKSESMRYRLDMKLHPNRSINMLQLTTNLPLTIKELRVEGKLLGKLDRKVRPGFIFRHLVTDEEQVNVSIQFESVSLPQFRLIETSFDLGSHFDSLKERSEIYMPSPFKQTDSVIISQPVTFR
jgi:hypothetical protein